MKISEIMHEIAVALNSDSQAVIVFEIAEAKGISSVTIYSDADDGLTADIVAKDGNKQIDPQYAFDLICYHSRAVNEVL